LTFLKQYLLKTLFKGSVHELTSTDYIDACMSEIKLIDLAVYSL